MSKMKRLTWTGPEVYPAWTKLYGSEQALIKEFVTIKFRGPGTYLTNEETLLILPVPMGEHINLTKKNVWQAKWPVGTAFRVYVWARPITETILSCVVPTKQDDRV